MGIFGKSNAWTPRVSCSSGPFHRGRTDEVSARNATIPVPIFMLGFTSSGAALSGIATGMRRSAPPSAHSPAFAKPPSEKPRDPPGPSADSAPAAAQVPPASDRPATPGKSDGIDLIIDKLPRHGLIKPIPVRIAPLGDRVFVASTPDLDITVTGNSLSDALLLLKQQLESTYESLSNKVSTKDQERQLSQMRAFIQDSRVGKSGW